MGIRDIVSVLTQTPTLLALKKGMQPRPLEERDCFAKSVQNNALQFADKSAVIFEDQSITWSELNQSANRYANYLSSIGVKTGDVVSVVMENRIEFLQTVIALNKIGAIAGLINTNLRGRPLTHCIEVTKSKKCIFGSELSEALEEVKDDLSLSEGEDYFVVPDNDETNLNWATNIDDAAASASNSNLEQTDHVTLGETAFYIFTSGTTGLPKAAVLSNRRFLASAMLSHKAGLKCNQKDRLYICLPLYHGTGLIIGVGAAFSSGASMFIRRRFSARNFLPEVRKYGATCLIYVGELCRYLTNSDAKPDDHVSPLRNMMGNGLRPDVWLDFKKRFGIKRISEFYGASEGNVAFANLMNKDCTIGMTSSRVALIKYDVETDEIERNDDNRCIEVEFGEPGLCLGHINPGAVFEGYTDSEATEKKVLRDVFEEGDAWFNTGDLIKEVDVGFSLGYSHYQFVDRVGDTFRWKSENVSTNEVGEIINGYHSVEISNVYGVDVPGADGKAGMAALRLSDGSTFDQDDFAQYVVKELPPFACPVFIRIQNELDVTGTFKMVKGDLKKEHYDIESITDPVYVMKPGTRSYEILDANYLALLKSGSAGF